VNKPMATPLLEEVVLLSEAGEAIGTARKHAVHTETTPLHSAFSIFLFNREGNMLVQQRACSKQTWPGIWSNACCGHPLPGESLEAAAHRRLRDELGLTELSLTLALPTFRYRAEFHGIVENEICPVLIGLCEQSPTPNPIEVEAVDWVSWHAFSQAALAPVGSAFEHFSPWSLLEAQQLVKAEAYEALLQIQICA
jgi:isopentenyl-diphosphate delta-isomerase